MIDKEVVREKLGSFVDLFRRECSEYSLRRAGDHFSTQCPFHEERTGSFHVYEDHGHCFGCGWNGDHFAFLQEARGLNFMGAVELAASWVGLDLSYARSVPDATQPRNVRPVLKRTASLEEKGRVSFPPGTRKLSAEEICDLAELRGLSVAAVRIVAHDYRRCGFARWPQFRGRRSEVGGQSGVGLSEVGDWREAGDCAGSWVVTDRNAWVAQYRRLDGVSYQLRDGRGLKAWTCGTPTWPLGASEMGDRPGVMLVEGGADMLAAYHFLYEIGKRLYRPGRADTWLLDRVAVVCMLGASNRFCEESLKYFKGKRVRIFMDADRAKPKPLRRAARAAWERRTLNIEHGTSNVAGVEGLACGEGAEAQDLDLDEEAALLEEALEWHRVKAEVEAEPFDAVTGLPVQPEGWKVASVEAAERWGCQLRDAGAVVCTMQLYGLCYEAKRSAAVMGWESGFTVRERVGDLNDLALCPESVWMDDPAIREGFTRWDF